MKGKSPRLNHEPQEPAALVETARHWKQTGSLEAWNKHLKPKSGRRNGRNVGSYGGKK